MPVWGCRKTDVSRLCAGPGHCHRLRGIQCAGLQALRLRNLAEFLSLRENGFKIPSFIRSRRYDSIQTFIARTDIICPLGSARLIDAFQ